MTAAARRGVRHAVAGAMRGATRRAGAAGGRGDGSAGAVAAGAAGQPRAVGGLGGGWTCGAGRAAARVPMPEKRWGTCIMTLMRLSARADYALRAAIELAAASSGHVTADQLARAQQIPGKFLETILTQLRRAGLIRSQRGPDGRLLAGPARRRRSRWPTSSGPSTASCSASGASARRTSPTRAWPNRCSRCGSRCAPTSGPCSSRSRWLTSCQGTCRTRVRNLTDNPSAWV